MRTCNNLQKMDMTQALSYRIILVEPSHSGNIGATARVIKTMGLSSLVLVRPKKLPDPEAFSMAAGAEDILEHARIVDTLKEALMDSHFAIGCSARERTLNRAIYTPEEAAEYCQTLDPTHTVSVVFGNERCGLTNDQLALCQAQVMIPTSSEYRSINLAQAVQIVSYVLTRAQNTIEKGSTLQSLAPHQEVENLHAHMAKTLKDMSFFIRPDPIPTLRKLRSILDRTKLDRQEVAMLRGIFASIDHILERQHER
jgi:TrmH family RNA methyltransferase